MDRELRLEWMLGVLRAAYLFAFLNILILSPTARALETLSGTVRTVGGIPLANIDLDVFNASGGSVAIGPAATDGFGHYVVTLPGPGTYIIRADPTAAQGVAAQYFNQVFLKSAAQRLVVGPGQALGGIDFALPPGVSLQGRVTGSGVPLADMDIDVFASNGEFLGAYPARTRLDGTYTVGALPPGSYFVRADPDITLGQYFVKSFFGGSMSLAGATPIAVGSAPVSGVDINLVPGGSIAGTVTAAATGLPLGGIDVDLFDALGNRISVDASTDLTGAYQIGPVPPGNYILRMDPTIAQGFARTYYVDAGTMAGAVVIPVSVGVATGGIDLALTPGATISGTIRDGGSGAPLAAIDLDLFDATGRITDMSAASDPSGFYRIGPMKAGTWFLRADPSPLQGFAEQFFSNAIDVKFASPIVVTGGADAPGIDFGLQPAGSIAGVLFDPNGQPAAGVDLDLFEAVTGARLRKGAASALDGSYLIDSLNPGTYKLRADPTPAQGYALDYFDARLNRSLADPVSVVGHTTTAGVDFHLVGAGTLTGTVSDATLSAPVAGADLEALQAGSWIALDQAATTDLAGNFTLTRLPPGDYLVRVNPGVGQTFPPTYFGNVTVPSLATAVSLIAGQAKVGIDIAVPEPAGAASELALLFALVALNRCPRRTRPRRHGKGSAPGLR